jgi:hypothetical protein
MVKVVHTEDGIVIRVDHHLQFIKTMEELALIHKNVVTNNTGKKTMVLRNRVLDELMNMFWPGKAKDIDVISTPSSDHRPCAEFNAKR